MPSNGPNIVCKVFKIKLDELMSDFKKRTYLERLMHVIILAVVFVIECFYKCIFHILSYHY